MSDFFAGVRPGWIAHAGLGRHLPGGTPTRETIERALDLGVEAIELDVCVTSDRVLVLRHDRLVDSRVEVRAMTLATLRHAVPSTLTLAEGLATIGRRADILLDIKTEDAARVLSVEFAARPPADNISVCTELPHALLVLRRRAPAVPRWLAVPNIGGNAGAGTRAVVSTMVQRRSPAMAASVANGLSRAALAAARNPVRALAYLCGIPWKSWLAAEIVGLARAVDASGVCLHHWLADPAVVGACHEAGLPVVAYTVNRRGDAERALRAGVDLITTDSVEPMRRAAGRADHVA